MADVTLAVAAVEDTPLDYPVPGAAELLIKMLSASYDGSSAAGSFVPAVQVIIGGTIVAGTFPLGQTLAAGASADVSWFPRGGMSSGGGPTPSTVATAVYVDTPDVLGNGFPLPSTAAGFTQPLRIVPAFTPAVDGSWEGAIVVPEDYSSGAAVVLTLVTDNSAASLATRFRVSSSVVADGSSLGPAYTDEAYVNIAVPATALERFDQIYTLSTTPAAGDVLNVKVTRNGSNAGDTLTTLPVLLWACTFTYTN